MTETAWMIENHAGQPEWWTGDGWTTDAGHGLRFARKQDAEVILQKEKLHYCCVRDSKEAAVDYFGNQHPEPSDSGQGEAEPCAKYIEVEMRWRDEVVRYIRKREAGYALTPYQDDCIKRLALLAPRKPEIAEPSALAVVEKIHLLCADKVLVHKHEVAALIDAYAGARAEKAEGEAKRKDAALLRIAELTDESSGGPWTHDIQRIARAALASARG